MVPSVNKEKKKEDFHAFVSYYDLKVIKLYTRENWP